jgi:hypothetical protein
LHTLITVTGAEATDQLRMAALGGNDVVDVTDAACALIGVSVDLGPGQHALTAGGARWSMEPRHRLRSILRPCRNS